MAGSPFRTLARGVPGAVASIPPVRDSVPESELIRTPAAEARMMNPMIAMNHGLATESAE